MFLWSQETCSPPMNQTARTAAFRPLPAPLWSLALKRPEGHGPRRRLMGRFVVLRSWTRVHRRSIRSRPIRAWENRQRGQSRCLRQARFLFPEIPWNGADHDWMDRAACEHHAICCLHRTSSAGQASVPREYLFGVCGALRERCPRFSWCVRRSRARFVRSWFSGGASVRVRAASGPRSRHAAWDPKKTVGLGFAEGAVRS